MKTNFRVQGSDFRGRVAPALVMVVLWFGLGWAAFGQPNPVSVYRNGSFIATNIVAGTNTVTGTNASGSAGVAVWTNVGPCTNVWSTLNGGAGGNFGTNLVRLEPRQGLTVFHKTYGTTCTQAIDWKMTFLLSPDGTNWFASTNGLLTLTNVTALATTSSVYHVLPANVLADAQFVKITNLWTTTVNGAGAVVNFLMFQWATWRTQP